MGQEPDTNKREKGKDPEALSYLDLPDEEDAPGYTTTVASTSIAKTTDVAGDDSYDSDEDNNGVTKGGSGNNNTSRGVVYADANPPLDIPKVKTGLASVGLILGLIFCFIELGGDRKINQTLSIAIWMATLWLTELIPAVVTAFLPMFCFPLFGILSAAVVAKEYLTNLNWLFLSGFLMSMTIERWDLHKRFSLKVLTWCGTSPKPLLLGIMFATYFISMFISNTATSLMMVVNGVSICASINENLDVAHKSESKRFGRAVMLGIAYAANLGGMSSLIGTGPNLAFARQLGILFPDAPEFTFADWWFFGLPTGLIFFFIVWLYLCMIYLRNFESAGTIDKNLFIDQYAAMGPWTLEQRAVAALFAILSLGWVFRADLNFSTFVIKGWRNAFPTPGFITDTTLGMTIGFILFVTPARVANLPLDNRFSIKPDETSDGKKIEAGKDRKAVKEADNWTTLLNWHVANQMPYDILFLLGGGFALAKAFVESGLSAFLGEKLAGMGVSVSTLLYVMIFFIIWLTELTSNTSTSNIMIPIAGSLARAMNVSPYTFMIPATMACSCAFFLPIATPPNMVVYSTGMIELREMNKAGVFLNILCSVLLWIAAYTIIPAITGVPANDFPEWAVTLPEEADDACRM